MTIVLTKLQHSQIKESSCSKLQAFQRKIYLKAKANSDYKFYCLYDKVFRKDVLKEAFKRVKANRGSSGIDGVELIDLEDKEEAFINELHTELKQKSYQPSKLKEVQIPKKNGKTRTLRIPTVKDRVVQQAVKLIIEPIFEADFQECSYGYRPKRSAHDQIRKLSRLLFKDIYTKEKKRIESVDFSNCFDTIPHKELLQLVARRVIDRQLLKLIKSFLKAGIMEAERGTPQGGVISPLLANIYLDKLDTYWHKHFRKSNMFRYADDIVAVLTKDEQQQFQMFLDYVEQDLKLTINREKSHATTTKDGLDILGFTLREKTSKSNKQYLAVEPTKDAIKRVHGRLCDILKWNGRRSTEDMIQATNSVLHGWQQYFDNISMGKIRSQVNWFVNQRVGKAISRRKRYNKATWKLFGNNALQEKYGLYVMKSLGRKFI
jgi:RNA-directed DNA polymerase